MEATTDTKCLRRIALNLKLLLEMASISGISADLTYFLSFRLPLPYNKFGTALHGSRRVLNGMIYDLGVFKRIAGISWPSMPGCDVYRLGKRGEGWA